MVNTFCLTSLKKGYVSVRYLAEKGEGRNVAIKKKLTVTGCPSLSIFIFFILVHTYLEGADCESFWIPLTGLNCWRCGSGPILSGWIFQKVSALIEPKGTLFFAKTPNLKRR